MQFDDASDDMSLCDRCYDPGACCRRFFLYEGGEERTFRLFGPGSVDAFLEERELPFEPHLESQYVDGEGCAYARYSFRVRS